MKVPDNYAIYMLYISMVKNYEKLNSFINRFYYFYQLLGGQCHDHLFVV